MSGVPAVQPNELIKIKQLPVIEEQLKVISADIQAQRDEALALEATEENVALVRTKRAELNKTFKDLENRRIAVKKAVMAPYDEFEAVYKKYVTDVCKPADLELKNRIDNVDQILIDEKTTELITHFESLAKESNIDVVKFADLDLKINRSASLNKLKEQIEDTLDKVKADLEVIGSMEHSAEILVEYHKTRDLAQSVLMVNQRKEQLAELERQKIEQEAQRQAQEVAVEVTPPPTEIVEEKPIAEPEPEDIPFMMPFEADFEEEDAEQEVTTTVIVIRAISEEQVNAITALCQDLGVEYTAKEEV